ITVCKTNDQLDFLVCRNSTGIYPEAPKALIFGTKTLLYILVLVVGNLGHLNWPLVIPILVIQQHGLVCNDVLTRTDLHQVPISSTQRRGRNSQVLTC